MDPTERFTGRVEDYARYRPSYPAELLPLLWRELGLVPRHVVADIGSGTGILTRLLLEHGNVVYAVEPNAAMREVAQAALAEREGFRSVDGRAEETHLESAAVDFVVAGQAFHWFDVDGTRREWRRILRPGGWVVLVWNHRRTAGTPFLEGYEALLEQWCPEYGAVRERYENQADLREFFRPQGYEARTLENAQELDRVGLRGRLLSSSYAPGPGGPQHPAMLAALAELFDAHQTSGRVRIEYDTMVYFGRLSGER